ncbi:branched-chain amino acid ABC transporter substrate-binding protein [Actinomadura darangshiensis]|uniref:Branched-chain amino acid ABC transporter substrate-binding protein n=1 Tax=Actinomadura darangshiensis TaxID=705336 RepID=A0A4R5BEH9_9ACTN|nr:amino acid ABC transporter substrate-binding protein [Actinomadura darangshiensis]TDD83240.1 branched-chain amino acid ABC transporter substrate-binding protein [Actinomadura darangshiensis]
MHTRKAAALVTAVALVAAGCGSKGEHKASGGGDTLQIGASLSLTGSLAREGGLTKEGYELCRQAVNAKGGVPVGSKKLKLDIKYQDDTSKPDTAAQLVDQFNDKGVKLILGPYGSATTEAAAAVIERNGQVMADSSGADDKIFQKGYRRTFAALSPAHSYAASMVQAINEMAKPKPSTMAFLSADDGFSKTVAESGAEEARRLGFKVVATEYFPSGTSDVSSALTKVKPMKPDVIIGSVHVAEGIAIIKQARELGVRPAGGFAETVAPPTPDFAKSLGADAEGVLGSTQWTDTTTGKDKWIGSAKDYATAFKAAYGGRAPEYHGAEATAACLALVFAVEKAGSTDADKVRDALAGLNEPTFFGPLKFTAQGQNLTKKMQVVQIQKGRPVSVWPKDVAEAPMVWPGTGK